MKLLERLVMEARPVGIHACGMATKEDFEEILGLIESIDRACEVAELDSLVAQLAGIERVDTTMPTEVDVERVNMPLAHVEAGELWLGSVRLEGDALERRQLYKKLVCLPIQDDDAIRILMLELQKVDGNVTAENQENGNVKVTVNGHDLVIGQNANLGSILGSLYKICNVYSPKPVTLWEKMNFVQDEINGEIVK